MKIIMDDLNESDSPSHHFKRLKVKKDALELKISEKCFELKKLCIAEAELTGTLPLEIPLGPDESPPKIRRRIGTMFPYTEEVISRLEINQLAGLPPSLCKSPKRKTPLTQWNGGFASMPSRSAASQSASSAVSSPKSGGTWPGLANKISPSKQLSSSSTNRPHPYRLKLNSLFRKCMRRVLKRDRA